MRSPTRKIRFVHQYFHPDLSAVSQVISQVALDLAARDHEVSVICSRNRYDGAQKDPLPSLERIDGVEIRRCWGPSFGRKSRFGYILDMVSFILLASIRVLIAPRVDTVVFLTNPPLFSFFGLFARKIRGERFVYILMDVYPDIAIRSGVIRDGSFFARGLHAIAKAALTGADLVVVLGEDMREVAVRSGVPPGKVVVIRNWADPEKIVPVSPEENRLRREWGLEGKFVVEYSGNFGVSQSFEELLAAAKELSANDDIRFLFIGGGTRLKEVERIVSANGLANVVLKPYQMGSELSRSLSVGDVHYVSLRAGFEGLVVPSKAYGIMAAGRPMIYQGDDEGEIARMIRKERIGMVVAPGNRKELLDGILAFHRDHAMAVQVGNAARRALLERYSASVGLGLYREVLAGSN